MRDMQQRNRVRHVTQAFEADSGTPVPVERLISIENQEGLKTLLTVLVQASPASQRTPNHKGPN